MKTPHFVSQFAENEGLRSTVEAVATHPKVTVAAVVGNGSVIAAINTEMITGYLAFFSSILTALISTVMAAYWMVKLTREWVGMKKDMKE